jgi:hypothetical protein
MNDKINEAEKLLREYCKTFEFRATTRESDLWVGTVGPIVKNSAQTNSDEICITAPTIYVNMRGEIVSERGSETTIINPDTIKQAIGREILRKMK